MNGFDVFPKVVPANKVSEIRIRPRYKYLALHAEDDISVKYFPYAGLWSDAAKASLEDASKDTTLSKDVWRLENGELIIQMEFAAEQEHRFVVCLASPTVRRPTSEFSAVVYSVDPDLYALRPFRGDFHLHTIGSDGKEDCLYMAARCREIGMDFAAISDHRRMEPSLEAIDYWRKYDLDFKLYPGEEVHAPDNHVHVINFGASRSVNQMYRDDEAGYRAAVAKLMSELDGLDDMELDEEQRFAVAATEWVFDRIRENGGLAVYCHPYWFTMNNVLPFKVVDAVFKRGKFDALELIGGFNKFQNYSNNFQVNRWREETQKGRNFPVVGLSDSHASSDYRINLYAHKKETWVVDQGASLFGWYYTIIFAEDDSVPSLVSNVRKFHSVAACGMSGEETNLYGDFRLVRYASFLFREYFPIHNDMCATEGKLMLNALAGDEQSARALAVLKGQIPAFRERCFKRCI